MATFFDLQKWVILIRNVPSALPSSHRSHYLTWLPELDSQNLSPVHDDSLIVSGFKKTCGKVIFMMEMGYDDKTRALK